MVPLLLLNLALLNSFLASCCLSQTKKEGGSKGFTLIEMITVMAIFFVVTGIILANAPQFRDRLSIDLVANEVAINIRTAQVYGSATKTSLKNPGVYPSFGIHFDSAKDTEFLLYSVDTSDTQKGEGGGFKEDATVEETYVLPTGFKFVGLCDELTCGSNMSNLDILYRRPKLDAEFYTENPENECIPSRCDGVVVVLQSIKEGKQKKVVIYRSGQISIENITL